MVISFIKADTICNFYTGETVLSLQKATLIPGGSESLVYTTIAGRIGMLVPFTSREVSGTIFSPVKFLQTGSLLWLKVKYLYLYWITLSATRAVLPRGPVRTTPHGSSVTFHLLSLPLRNLNEILTRRRFFSIWRGYLSRQLYANLYSLWWCYSWNDETLVLY